MVSDSPHLVLMIMSVSGISSRWRAVASPTIWTATRLASSMIFRSPLPSMEKAATGLPVAAMPSATRRVQLGSMPMTTAAATFGLAPVPISVRKCSSRSGPNCRRP